MKLLRIREILWDLEVLITLQVFFLCSFVNLFIRLDFVEIRRLNSINIIRFPWVSTIQWFESRLDFEIFAHSIKCEKCLLKARKKSVT